MYYILIVIAIYVILECYQEESYDYKKKVI
jgi:hypothetical protein